MNREPEHIFNNDKEVITVFHNGCLDCDTDFYSSNSQSQYCPHCGQNDIISFTQPKTYEVKNAQSKLS